MSITSYLQARRDLDAARRLQSQTRVDCTDCPMDLLSRWADVREEIIAGAQCDQTIRREHLGVNDPGFYIRHPDQIETRCQLFGYIQMLLDYPFDNLSSGDGQRSIETLNRGLDAAYAALHRVGLDWYSAPYPVLRRNEIIDRLQEISNRLQREDANLEAAESDGRQPANVMPVRNSNTESQATADVGACYLATAHLLQLEVTQTRMTVSEFARKFGFDRRALYQNVEFEPFRVMAKKLHGWFQKSDPE